jgi:hypothetical protein
LLWPVLLLLRFLAACDPVNIILTLCTWHTFLCFALLCDVVAAAAHTTHFKRTKWGMRVVCLNWPPFLDTAALPDRSRNKKELFHAL